MTTIAWKAGVMVADKQASDGEMAHTCTKIYRRRGYAIGFSGYLQEGLEFCDWYHTRKGKCPLKKTDALVMNLTTGGCVHWEAKAKIGIPVEDPFTAIGSGAGLAIGAMEAGATPQEAVRIAAKRDPSTGCGLQVVLSKKRVK